MNLLLKKRYILKRYYYYWIIVFKFDIILFVPSFNKLISYVCIKIKNKMFYFP